MKNNLILVCIVTLFAMNFYALAFPKSLKEDMKNTNSENKVIKFMKKYFILV